jgi:hypothetical protein
MWDYKYQAKRADGPDILACDSLRKLKAAVADHGWRMAWITTSEGALSYGQQVVNEYPYTPRR